MPACSGFFARKLLVVQPRAYILFPSRIYPASSFIGLDLGLLPVNNGGGMLRLQRQVSHSVKEVAPSQRVVRFSGFEVDLRNGEVRKQGFKVRLQDQPFHVLQILLEHPGELVTREELQRQIWPADTFVDFEKGLNNAIKRLRDALGDSAETPRFIETLPRRGYRFTAPVTSTDGSAGAQEITSGNQRHEPRRWFRWGAAMASIAGLAAATLIGLKALRVRDRGLAGTPVPRIQSLAVLPLTNLSGDPAQEYFSDGMTDALITDLAQIGSLKVISRTSVMHYKKSDKTLPEIARELNVDGIVEGTVQRSGDRVRIDAQLIHGPSDKHLWANSYERDLRDVFVLERDVASDIAHQVQARLTTPNQAPVAQFRPINPKAFDAYLQGKHHLHQFAKGAGDEEKKEAAKYFQQAIDADPNFAPAFNGLANSHLGLLWPSRKDAEIATNAAERAVALDANSSDAHKILGDIKVAAWNWLGSEEEFRRAVALNPNSADAHGGLGFLLDVTGRLDEGWKQQQIALELDPNNADLFDFRLLCGLELRGEYDRAIAMLQMFVKSYPDDGYLHLELARDYMKRGMYKEAQPHMEQFWTLFGLPVVSVEVRRAFATSGYRGAILESAKAIEHLMATHQGFGPVTIAELYATVGDKERAFYWLEQAYAQHDIGIAGTDVGLEFLKVELLLEPLRSDPRYKDLVRRVGLPP